MSSFAIRYPFFILMACLAIVVIGTVNLLSMPVDLFPAVKIPVVVVATFYSGMPPEQVEADITDTFERFFTLGSGIDHIESRSMTGVSLIKIYFHAGTDPNADVSNISNLAMADLRRLPPGTLPPVVLSFDASNLPVCLITVEGQGLNQTQLKDYAQFDIRNQVANVQGASVPQPYGGTYRQVMVYVDPMKLEANGLSISDVYKAVNNSNLILPAGDVRIGPKDYNIYANSQVVKPSDANSIPLKTEGNSSVLVGDVGHAEDAGQLQYNVVRVNGEHSVYLPIFKQGGGSNTISIVNGVRRAGEAFAGCAAAVEGAGSVRSVDLCEDGGGQRDPRGRDRPAVDGADDSAVSGQPAGNGGGNAFDSAIYAGGISTAECHGKYHQHDGAGRTGAGAFAADR